MIQVNNQALYIDYVKEYSIIKSYATPIIFTHNGKLYTTDTFYSKTTTKHKYQIMKDFKQKDIIIITQKVFNQIMKDNGVSLGIA